MGGLAQRNRLLPFLFAGNWDANTLLAAVAPLGMVREGLSYRRWSCPGIIVGGAAQSAGERPPCSHNRAHLIDPPTAGRAVARRARRRAAAAGPGAAGAGGAHPQHQVELAAGLAGGGEALAGGPKARRHLVGCLLKGDEKRGHQGMFAEAFQG
jgi:hypothetical protein